jgi:hypothetical protein
VCDFLVLACIRRTDIPETVFSVQKAVTRLTVELNIRPSLETPSVALGRQFSLLGSLVLYLVIVPLLGTKSQPVEQILRREAKQRASVGTFHATMLPSVYCFIPRSQPTDA